MSQHILPLKTYYRIFAALMTLLVVTVAAAYLPLGPLNLPVALSIAGVKAALIVLYFMHVKFSNKLTWVFSSAAFLWLAILIVLSMNDYLTRGWLHIEGK